MSHETCNQKRPLATAHLGLITGVGGSAKDSLIVGDLGAQELDLCLARGKRGPTNAAVVGANVLVHDAVLDERLRVFRRIGDAL